MISLLHGFTLGSEKDSCSDIPVQIIDSKGRFHWNPYATTQYGKGPNWTSFGVSRNLRSPTPTRPTDNSTSKRVPLPKLIAKTVNNTSRRFPLLGSILVIKHLPSPIKTPYCSDSDFDTSSEIELIYTQEQKN